MERFLGRYEILGELGRGGMGTVHEARHTLLGKTVAIKVLLPHLAQDREQVARFMREARAAANLEHPHIVQVFDVDQAGDVHFFAMERIAGETLRARILARGPLSADETLRIAGQVADALAFAHARGIVHRDLKPANIMLDQRGQVKVMDFGIAAAAGGETLTITGQVLGTPKYMAPEQARGEVVDGRSDLFSLGMTMCEMLAGRTPLDGKDVISAVGMLLHHEPFVLGLPADVPANVHAIVVRLTQKQRDARYPTATALTQDLARAARGLPIAPSSATGDSAMDAERTVAADRTVPAGRRRDEPPVRARSRRPFAIAGVAAIAALAALAVARWQSGVMTAGDAPETNLSEPGTTAGLLSDSEETGTEKRMGTDTTGAEPSMAAGGVPPARTPADRPAASDRRDTASTAVAAKPSPPPPGSARGAVAPPTPSPPATESRAEEHRDTGSGLGASMEEPPPAPPSTPDPAAERAAAVERLQPELDRQRSEVARAREAADADSAQATASYRAARALEDSLPAAAARADGTALNRHAGAATALFSRARNERMAILARRAAAEEQRRALAEPGRSSTSMSRAEELLAGATAAMARGDFTTARAGFDAARAEFARAARKPR